MFLVVGSGGREYAIIKKLAVTNDVCCYGSHFNPGICYILSNKYGNINNIKVGKLNDFNDIIEFSKEKKVKIAVIGPEAPLEKGICDSFLDNDIKCIGPTLSNAKIEYDKYFAREFLNTNCGLFKINPEYKYFPYNDYSNVNKLSETIIDYIEYLENKELKYVVKNVGLCGGKGVKVFGDHLHTLKDTLQHCLHLYENKQNFLIEEKLVGKEFSLMSFSDGRNLKHMPIVQDFKRAYEFDKGPNTGGMGSISYADHKMPFLSEDDVSFAQKINNMVILHLFDFKDCALHMNVSGYVGILYGSFIKTDKGIKVIEYNSRFGDPECLNIMSLLQTDLGKIFTSMIEGSLDKINIQYKNKASVCKYVVPLGYPLKSETNQNVFINKINTKDNIYFANCDEPNKDDIYDTFVGGWVDIPTKIKTMSSRLLAYVGLGDTLDEAELITQNEIEHIEGPVFYRSDIGKSKYSLAGVNIDTATIALNDMKDMIKSTYNNNVGGSFGDFGGSYHLDADILDGINGMNAPINPNTGKSCYTLVSSTDGVGTKSIMIQKLIKDKHQAMNILGQDLVNHSINDILVQGASPLFFLDYYASSKLEPEKLKGFISGIVESCKKYSCVLIGGETAEMPNVYLPEREDLVGTIVGIKNIDIDYSRISENNIAIAIPSDSPHTNGYSLIRKVLDNYYSSEGLTQNKEIQSIEKDLCIPHRCYLPEILQLITNNIKINGLCHITGGGLIENPPRILPKNMKLVLEEVKMPEYFKILQKYGNLELDEMYKVFNCGIGMIVIVDKHNVQSTLQILGSESYVCGYISLK